MVRDERNKSSAYEGMRIDDSGGEECNIWIQVVVSLCNMLILKVIRYALCKMLVSPQSFGKKESYNGKTRQ